ncbi:MAG: hypothetical protein AAF392_02820 [Bacteroidota bacterium]
MNLSTVYKKVIKHWCCWGGMILMLILPSYVIATTVKALHISSIGQKEEYDSEEEKERATVLEIHDNQLVTALNALIENTSKAEMEDVVVNTPEAIADAYDVDTDYEDSDPIDDLGVSSNKIDTKGYTILGSDSIKNRSRYSSRRRSTSYNFTNNYVKKGSTIPTSSSLAKDAKLIHESCKGDISRIVIFCVALRDKNEHIKKFAFHNSETVMSLGSRMQAEALGYDVIQAGQSHAEGQFLQFLHNRDQKRPGLYTHIIAMGCSKPHCRECDCLLQLVLGRAYKEITAAVKPSGADNPPEVIIADSSEDPAEFSIEKKCRYKVNIGDGAIEDKTYDNFYIPEGLKDLIQKQVGDKISFVGGKYTRAQSKKRKSSKSSEQVEQHKEVVHIAKEMRRLGIALEDLRVQMEALELDSNVVQE